jgi:phosphoribosylamine--glycine ligase
LNKIFSVHLLLFSFVAFNILMRILLLGSGGREHAFAWKLSKSPRCESLFIAPGNSGTASYGVNVPLSLSDFIAIGQFCIENSIDLVIPGPEEPIVNGIWDYFKGEPALSKTAILSPSAAGGRLEGSKDWAKGFMERHGVPTASYQSFGVSEIEDGLKYLKKHSYPVVLKADGLAAGKGVIIAEDIQEAQEALRNMLGGQFGAASSTVVIESFLRGIECSVFVLTDGKNYKILPEAKDYKRIGEGDTGLNTGGMGAISPVPFVTPALMDKIETRIIIPTIEGLKTEKIPYCGFVFIGLMIVGDDPFVIEYNCRMGDPETQVVFSRLRNDLANLLYAAAKGKLKPYKIKVLKAHAAAIVLVSGGYPGDFEKGQTITGLDNVGHCQLFHGGMARQGEKLLTSGGRVATITSNGSTRASALKKALKGAKTILYEGKYYRRDIGKDVE